LSWFICSVVRHPPLNEQIDPTQSGWF